MRHTRLLSLLLCAGCVHTAPAARSSSAPEAVEPSSSASEQATEERLATSDADAAPTSGDAEDAAGHGHGHDHGHSQGYAKDFSAVKAYAARFDSPARDAWQKPDEVVRLLEVHPGQTVADVGAGTGYFLPSLDGAVGPEGHVLALDVEPNMVRYMQERARDEGLSQVEARQVAPDDPGLPPASVDRILIVNTWHHISERPRYAAKLREALRQGGLVMIVDFTRESDQGPPKEYRLSPSQVIDELALSGLEAHVAEETLPKQYVVVAHAKPAP